MFNANGQSHCIPHFYAKQPAFLSWDIPQQGYVHCSISTTTIVSHPCHQGHYHHHRRDDHHNNYNFDQFAVCESCQLGPTGDRARNPTIAS